MEQQEVPQQKKDETLNGLLIIAGVIVVLIGFMYLLSRQQKSSDCVPTYNPDGTVLSGCGETASDITPTPDISVEVLDQLNENQVQEVDKRLQEAAEDLRERQKAQQQSQPQQQTQPQQQIPPLPQQ